MFPFWFDLSASSLAQILVLIIGVIMWFTTFAGTARS